MVSEKLVQKAIRSNERQIKLLAKLEGALQNLLKGGGSN